MYMYLRLEMAIKSPYRALLSDLSEHIDWNICIHVHVYRHRRDIN